MINPVFSHTLPPGEPMKIGIISKKPHAKNHAQALQREGHEVVLLDGNPTKIPPSIELVVCRTASCSHEASNVALEWKRRGGGYLVMENGLSGALRKIRQIIEPKAPVAAASQATKSKETPVPSNIKKMTEKLVAKATIYLAEGRTLTAIAKELGVARSTLTGALVKAGGWPAPTLSPTAPEKEQDEIEESSPLTDTELQELIETWAVLVIETRPHDSVAQRLEVMQGLMDVEVDPTRLQRALSDADPASNPVSPDNDLSGVLAEKNDPPAVAEPPPVTEKPEEVEVAEVPAEMDLTGESMVTLPPTPSDAKWLKVVSLDRVRKHVALAEDLFEGLSGKDIERVARAFLAHDAKPKKSGAWIPRDLRRKDSTFAGVKGKPLAFVCLVFFCLDEDAEPSPRAFTHAYKELTGKGTDYRFIHAGAWALGRTLGQAGWSASRGVKERAVEEPPTVTSGYQALDDFLEEERNLEEDSSASTPTSASFSPVVVDKDGRVSAQELESVYFEVDRLKAEVEALKESLALLSYKVEVMEAAPKQTGLPFGKGVTLDLTMDDLIEAGFQVRITKPSNG